MTANQNFRKFFLGVLIVCLSSGLIAGCAEKQKVTPDDQFLQKWQAKAEASKGTAPAARTQRSQPVAKTIQTLPDPIRPVVSQKPLPQKRISLKMSNVDVAVLLRALAQGGGREHRAQ